MPTSNFSLDNVTDRVQWGNAFAALFASNRRLRCWRDANASATNPAVTGTEFLNVALTGTMQVDQQTGIVTSLGLASDATVRLAADLATGACAFRITSGSNYLQGTLGLTGSGKDVTLTANPTTTTGIGFLNSFQILPPTALPLPQVADTTAPTVSLAANSTSFTTAATLTLTATATDNVGVTKVEFYDGATLIGTDTTSPYTASASLTHAMNGTRQYTAKAFDAAGNTSTSAAVTVTVNIPAPVEAPGAVAVGGKFTDVQFQNTSTSTQTNVPVTFGQWFIEGTFPASSAAVDLKAGDGSLITCQLDVKNYHPDGTVRHAILSAILPVLAPSATTSYDIVRRAAPPPGSAAVPADFPGLNAIATLADTGTSLSGPGTATTYTANASSILSGGTYTTWLSGPVVSEWIMRVPLKTAGNVEHPDLHARFYIRAYKGQNKVRISYVIENAWAKPKNPQPTATGASPWELVSIAERVYRLSYDAGSFSAYVRATNGRVPLELQSGTALATTNTCGLANNSTVYTATVEIDGTSYPISVTGSSVQTYAALFSAITSQAANKTNFSFNDPKTGFYMQSNTTGPTSKVRITNYGSLFPALKYSGITGGTLTAQITINGSIVKDISINGANATTYGKFCEALNAILGADATATPQLAAPGYKIVSTATGLESDVVITNPGNLFRDTPVQDPIRKNYLRPYRPIDGDEILHYPRTRHIRRAWWSSTGIGTEPTVHIIHNKNYLYATKGAPAYDMSVTIQQAGIDTDYNALLATRDIHSVYPILPAMPNTGVVPHIGLLNKWQAVWFLSQNVKAKATMLAAADRAGFFPVYWRDYDTDLPLNLENWPYASTTINAGDTRNAATGLNEKLPDLAMSGNNPPYWNIPDTAHHPDFFWFPYMITGDHYYMEGQLFHQVYTGINYNSHATYRDGKKLLPWRDQIRGQGWTLRTMVHTKYMLPASHPNAASIEYELQQNKLWYDTNMVADGSAYGSPLGWNFTYATAYNSGIGIAPWMNDFFTLSVGRMVELGETGFQTIANFNAKNITGRLTSGADFCWRGVAPYILNVRDTSTGPKFTTWAACFAKTYPSAVGLSCSSSAMSTALGTTDGSANGNPGDAASYYAFAKAATGYTCSQSTHPGAADAWLVISSGVLQPDFSNNPHWGFVPRS